MSGATLQWRFVHLYAGLPADTHLCIGRDAAEPLKMILESHRPIGIGPLGAMQHLQWFQSL